MELIPLMLIRVAGLPVDTLEAFRGEFHGPIAGLRAAELQLNDTKMALLQALSVCLQEWPDSAERQALYRFRAMLFEKNRLTPEANPFPMSAHVQTLAAQFQENQQAAAAAARALADLYEKVRMSGFAALQKLAGNEHLQHALGYAAPDLLHRLSDLEQKPFCDWLTKDRQRAFSLLQYLGRACCKTSPFSRLTTVCLAPPGPVPEEVWNIPKPVVTPNVALLPFVYEVLLQDDAFRQSILLRLNPAFEKLPDGRMRWLYFDGVQEAFQEMHAQEAVDCLVLELAGRVARSFEDLKNCLMENFSADGDQLSHFLNELIALGLLEWILPESGLSANWSAGLYQWLGKLPGSPGIVSAAMTMQWLRTTARNLPFQSPEASMESRAATRETLRAFGDQGGQIPPDIPLQNLFLEDVAWSANHALPETALRQFAGELQGLWRQCGPIKLPVAKAKALHFAQQINNGASVPFLTLAHAYVSQAPHDAPPDRFTNPYTGKIGALLQAYRDGANFRAVVNALYPGGGKLAARWLHLFPDPQRAEFENWMSAEAESCLPFPWHAWHNAVFQPTKVRLGIATPGGRIQSAESIPLSDVLVTPSQDGPWLSDGRSGRRFWLIDLGLETVGAKPPVMQLLWQLGTPYVSLTPLLQGRPVENLIPGWTFLPRIESGSIVLARREWRIEQAVWQKWLKRKGADFFFYLRGLFQEVDIPKTVFIQFLGEKPQFFDLDSPLFIQLLEKNLRKASGIMSVQEMLPGTDQLLLQREAAWHVGEWVCEFGALEHV